MSDWQPIETAPRDGRWFVIARAGEDDFMEVGRYSPMKHYRLEEAGGGLYRKVPYVAYEWAGFSNFHRATHWMPLSAPPQEARDA